MPRDADAGRTSSRSQSATCSAIVQRNVAGGANVTFVSSGRVTLSSSTASAAPHSPGPTSTGSGLNAASFPNRNRQGVGSEVAGAAPAAVGAGVSGNEA